MTTTARPANTTACPPKTIDEIIHGVNTLEIPHDMGAEAAVIGSIIIAPKSAEIAVAFLPTPDAFYRPENQVVYRVILDLIQNQTPIDAMIIHSELKSRGKLVEAGGIEYIKDLANAVPTSAHAPYYAALVKEKWMKRGAITTLLNALRELYEPTDGTRPSNAHDSIERAMAGLMAMGETNQYRMARSLREIVVEVREELSQKSTPVGLMTGLSELDLNTAGMHPGEMIVIAARPSVGKTSLAVNILQHACTYSDRNALMFSMEQRDRELVMRMLSAQSGVNTHVMRMRTMTDYQRSKVEAAAAEIGVPNIFIDDTPGLTLTDLFAKSRRLHSRRPLSLVVIDYIQLMECGGQRDRQQEITKISRGIKALARELNVPVIALSQLNRSSETEKRLPRTSDLRESGSLEQDADVVLLLHREAVLHRGDEAWVEANRHVLNDAYLIIGKQRNGPCETIKLRFWPAQTRFTDYLPEGVL